MWRRTHPVAWLAAAACALALGLAGCGSSSSSSGSEPTLTVSAAASLKDAFTTCAQSFTRWKASATRLIDR